MNILDMSSEAWRKYQEGIQKMLIEYLDDFRKKFESRLKESGQPVPTIDDVMVDFDEVVLEMIHIGGEHNVPKRPDKTE